MARQADVILEDKVLGVGSYGKVYKAKCGQLSCAAKVLHDSLLAGVVIARFEQECQFLSVIRHPNIVQCLGSLNDPRSQRLVLVMELMDESLTNFLKRSANLLPYHIQINICHDVALALSYLHGYDIVHRDLSSNNVLLMNEGSRAKVTDFGMSKLVDMNPRTTPELTQCPGTSVYMPPEALTTPPHYSSKLDCFSYGVLTIQIVTKNMPTPGDAHRAIDDPNYASILIQVCETERRKRDIKLIEPTHPLLPIALCCLENKDTKRPSIDEVCVRLTTVKKGERYILSVGQTKDQALLIQRLQEERQLYLRERAEIQMVRENHQRKVSEINQKLAELIQSERADCNEKLAEKGRHLTAKIQRVNADHQAKLSEMRQFFRNELDQKDKLIQSEIEKVKADYQKKDLLAQNDYEQLLGLLQSETAEHCAEIQKIRKELSQSERRIQSEKAELAEKDQLLLEERAKIQGIKDDHQKELHLQCELLHVKRAKLKEKDQLLLKKHTEIQRLQNELALKDRLHQDETAAKLEQKDQQLVVKGAEITELKQKDCRHISDERAKDQLLLKKHTEIERLQNELALKDQLHQDERAAKLEQKDQQLLVKGAEIQRLSTELKQKDRRHICDERDKDQLLLKKHTEIRRLQNELALKDRLNQDERADVNAKLEQFLLKKHNEIERLQNELALKDRLHQDERADLNAKLEQKDQQQLLVKGGEIQRLSTELKQKDRHHICDERAKDQLLLNKHTEIQRLQNELALKDRLHQDERADLNAKLEQKDQQLLIKGAEIQRLLTELKQKDCLIRNERAELNSALAEKDQLRGEIQRLGAYHQKELSEVVWSDRKERDDHVQKNSSNDSDEKSLAKRRSTTDDKV